MVVLFKVFSSVAAVWQPVLWGLIVITITIGNLFAVRQKNLKRFMPSLRFRRPDIFCWVLLPVRPWV